ncbi:hypothetical protein LINPERPRIM_LOCUS4335, partial [Linum perenne]
MWIDKLYPQVMERSKEAVLNVQTWARETGEEEEERASQSKETANSGNQGTPARHRYPRSKRNADRNRMEHGIEEVFATGQK